MLAENAACAQENIFSVLHLNKERDYSAAKPKKIIEAFVFYSPNGAHSEKHIKIFDNAGMLLTEDRFDESGTVTTRLSFTNDTAKHLIKAMVLERWNSFGNSNEKKIYTYDANNFLIRTEDETINGKTFNRSEIKNNAKGDPIEIAGFDGDGNSFGKEIAIYFYDQNKVQTSVISSLGKIISVDTIKISFKKTAFARDTEETFNDKGDITSYISKSANGTLTTYKEEYQYDLAGNCTENKIYETSTKPNGKQKLRLVRVYKKEYFY